MPVVLCRDETGRGIGFISALHQPVVTPLYGPLPRMIACLRLRVQDRDVSMKTITLRSGKGDKDRVTAFPAMITTRVKERFYRVRLIYGMNQGERFGKGGLVYAKGG